MSTKAPPAEPTITAAELADELRCSVDKVYQLANAGELPGFRLGREWRFYPSVVREHLTKPKDRWAQSKRSSARGRAS